MSFRPRTLVGSSSPTLRFFVGTGTGRRRTARPRGAVREAAWRSEANLHPQDPQEPSPPPKTPDPRRALIAILAAGVVALGGYAGAAGAAHNDGAQSRSREPVAAQASAAEDATYAALRRVDAALDAALGAAGDAVLGGGGGMEGVSKSNDAAARLVREVWEVVDASYSDVRGGGFDRAKWAELRDRELSSLASSRAPAPPQDAAAPLVGRRRAAAERSVRRLLAEGVPGDPYTRWLSPDEFRGFLKYDVSGIGLNLGTREDLESKTGLSPKGNWAGSGPEGSWVVGVVAGSAAEKAGIVQGDRVVGVDGADVATMRPFDVASLVARGGSGGGEEGARPAPLSLSLRSLDGAPREVAGIPRPAAPTAPPAVTQVRLDARSGVGTVVLDGLNARSRDEVLSAVVDLEARGATRLSLDLRSNRGGLVSEGVEVASLFLDPGAVVVRTEGARVPREPQTVPSTGPGGERRVPATRLPLEVVVGDRTASAAEILAGALRDNCRAALVGRSNTYGKGLIQSVFQLEDGSGRAEGGGCGRRALSPSSS